LGSVAGTRPNKPLVEAGLGVCASEGRGANRLLVRSTPFVSPDLRSNTFAGGAALGVWLTGGS